MVVIRFGVPPSLALTEASRSLALPWAWAACSGWMRGMVCLQKVRTGGSRPDGLSQARPADAAGGLVLE